MWTTLSSLLAAVLLMGSCLQLLLATEDDVTPRISFSYSKSTVRTICFPLEQQLGDGFSFRLVVRVDEG